MYILCLHNKKYHIVGTVLTSNRNVVERSNIVTHNPNIWQPTYFTWYRNCNKKWRG